MRELERACEGQTHVFAPPSLRSGAITGRRCAAWSELMPHRAAHRANHPCCCVSRDAAANRHETPPRQSRDAARRVGYRVARGSCPLYAKGPPTVKSYVVV